MAHDQKKRNLLILLFFLAILFVAIGFEHGSTVSGFYSRQPIYPETWSLACEQSPSAILSPGQDLAKSLSEVFSCTDQRLLEDYCIALQTGATLLQKGITLDISCTSLTALSAMRTDCITYIQSAC